MPRGKRETQKLKEGEKYIHENKSEWTFNHLLTQFDFQLVRDKYQWTLHVYNPAEMKHMCK